MRLFALFALFLAAAPALRAQAPAKPGERKTMTFQPGANTPDEHAKAAAAAANAANAAAAASGAPSGLVPDLPTNGSIRKPSGDECLDLAGVFFDSLKQGLIDDAYTNLTKGSKIGDRPEELRNLKQKTSEAISLFGQIGGFEVIENKTVGSTLRRYTIVSFGRDFPLRWRFYFYKVENAWRLIDLHVDDRLSGIFSEETETAEPRGQ